MNYQKILKIIRATKGYSQKDLADKTGIDRTLISKIESGERNPTMNTLERISSRLNIPLHLIVFMASGMKNRGEVSENEILQVGKTFIKLINTQ